MLDPRESYETLATLIEAGGGEMNSSTALLLRAIPRLDHASAMMAMGILFVIVQVGAEVTGARFGDDEDACSAERLRHLRAMLMASMECLDTICANSAHPQAPVSTT